MYEIPKTKVYLCLQYPHEVEQIWIVVYERAYILKNSS